MLSWSLTGHSMTRFVGQAFQILQATQLGLSDWQVTQVEPFLRWFYWPGALVGILFGKKIWEFCQVSCFTLNVRNQVALHWSSRDLTSHLLDIAFFELLWLCSPSPCNLWTAFWPVVPYILSSNNKFEGFEPTGQRNYRSYFNAGRLLLQAQDCLLSVLQRRWLKTNFTSLRNSWRSTNTICSWKIKHLAYVASGRYVIIPQDPSAAFSRYRQATEPDQKQS